MRSGLGGAAIAVLLAVPAVGAAEAPKAVVASDGYQFGKVVRGATIEHDFTVKNDGTVPLRIKSARTTAPLLVTRMPAEVAAGSEVALRFQLDTSGLDGPFAGRIVLSLNDPALPEAALAFAGQVVPPIELSPMPAFFVAAQRGEHKQASIEIINHEPEPLHIEKVEHPRGRFETKLETLEEGRRYRLALTVNPDGPGGKAAEAIVIKTSSRSTPVLTVAANTYLRERMYTFPETLDLGALRASDIEKSPEMLQRAAQTLMVYQVGGKSFEARPRTDLAELQLRSERGPAGDRYQITATLVKEKIRVGPIEGAIVIDTNDPDFPTVTVPVSGLIVDSDS